MPALFARLRMLQAVSSLTSVIHLYARQLSMEALRFTLSSYDFWRVNHSSRQHVQTSACGEDRPTILSLLLPVCISGELLSFPWQVACMNHNPCNWFRPATRNFPGEFPLILSFWPVEMLCDFPCWPTILPFYTTIFTAISQRFATTMHLLVPWACRWQNISRGSILRVFPLFSFSVVPSNSFCKWA